MLTKVQSGFWAIHSMESALLKVANDLLLALDSGNCAILVLLNLSAAFDNTNTAFRAHGLHPKQF